MNLKISHPTIISLLLVGSLIVGTGASDFPLSPAFSQDNSMPPNELLSKAWENYRKGKFRNTKSLLARIPRRYNDNPDINYLLGQIFYKENKFLRAKNHLQKVLPELTDPKSKQAVQHLIERSQSFYELDLRKHRFSQFVVLRIPDISSGLPSKINHALLKAYHQIGGDLDYFPDQRITVILYPAAEFRRLVGAPVWSGGVFDGKIHIPIRKDENKPFTERTLYHEYSHAVAYHLARDNLPLWFNEGLATYQEHHQTPGFFRYHRLPEELPERNLESLSDIDQMFKGKQDKKGARLAYEYSYSLIEFMKERYGITTVTRLLKRAGESGSFDEAMEQTLNRSIHSFQRQWELWLRREFR